jgi:hypothetical protein
MIEMFGFNDLEFVSDLDIRVYPISPQALLR